MTRILAALVAAAALTLPAYGQQKDKKALTEQQQQRMQQCNAEAKRQQFVDKNERQTFMNLCLKGELRADKTRLTPQQQKRTAACDQEAAGKGLQGNDRTNFMRDCIKR